nr:hypothetical protein [Bryobacterales bacterium]
MTPLSIEDYPKLSCTELLACLASGSVGFDHSFLDAFLRHPEAAIQALEAFVDGDHAQDRVDVEEQVFDLFRHLRTPRALPFYLLLLRAQTDGVQEELIEAFAELGEPAVEPLLSLYAELDEEESGEVAFLLAALPVRDPRITDVLLGRLEYDAQDAAICLGIHGDPAARPTLEKLLQDVASQPEAALLKTDVEEALTRLNDTPETARAPFNIYEQYESFQPPYFEVMDVDEALTWFASPDARVRQAVAESLDDEDITAPVARQLVSYAEREEHLGVRCAIWKSLLPAQPNPELLASLKAHFQNPQTDVAERATLAIVLAKMDYSAPLKSKLLDFYSNEETRALGLEAMWYTAEPEFLPLIQAHLEDADIAIRRAAILGVGFFVDKSSAPRLTSAMQIEDLRSDAIYSYALAHPGEVSRVTAQKVLRHVDE